MTYRTALKNSSFPENCLFPRRNGGILRCRPCSIRISSISNPWSAITESPGSSRSRRPLRLVNSEMDPGKSDETNVITPSGEIPTSPLNVLFLYIVVRKCHLLKFGELGLIYVYFSSIYYYSCRLIFIFELPRHI